MNRPLPLKRLPVRQLRCKRPWWIPLYPILGPRSRCLAPGLIWRSGPRPSGFFNLAFNPGGLLHSLPGLIAFDGNPLTTSWTWLSTAGLTIGFDGNDTKQPRAESP